MSDEVVQVVMHPAFFSHFKDWINRQMVELVRLPSETDTDLPTYLVTPSEEAWRAAR